jgi:hypothetical protein
MSSFDGSLKIPLKFNRLSILKKWHSICFLSLKNGRRLTNLFKTEFVSNIFEVGLKEAQNGIL